ncbi:DUF6301 family protein [Nocardia sp. NPDC056541]|uniref:DUF6301 family protein n=1 Tax=Nocardia sp. NPDC056541 TaxID=3345860 RepID=UPI00366B5B12
MQVDVAGAIRVARLAVDFGWSWTTEDVHRFCDTAGWQLEPFGYDSADLRTNLGTAQPIGRVYRDLEFFEDEGLPEQEITQILVRVADDGPRHASPESRADLSDLFAELADGFTGHLGDPARRFSGGTPMIAWERLDVVIVLRAVTESISLRIINPIYQASAKQLRRGSDGEKLEQPVRTVRPSQDNWLDFSTALASTLVRMASGGKLLLGVPEGRGALFSMGWFDLECQIALGEDLAVAKTNFVQQRMNMTEQGWESPPGTSWFRSIRWPSKYQEYESMSDHAIDALRAVLQVAHPHDLEISAWQESLDSPSSVPDITAFRGN